MRALSLSDDEMTAILRAAEPLQAHHRSAFLEDVVAALIEIAEPLGPGIVHRTIASIQHRYWGSPDLTGLNYAKYR
jgi:hypothetical protein